MVPELTDESREPRAEEEETSAEKTRREEASVGRERQRKTP